MKKQYATPQIACLKIAGQNILQQSQPEIKISQESFNSSDHEDL